MGAREEEEERDDCESERELCRRLSWPKSWSCIRLCPGDGPLGRSICTFVSPQRTRRLLAARVGSSVRKKGEARSIQDLVVAKEGTFVSA